MRLLRSALIWSLLSPSFAGQNTVTLRGKVTGLVETGEQHSVTITTKEGLPVVCGLSSTTEFVDAPPGTIGRSSTGAIASLNIKLGTELEVMIALRPRIEGAAPEGDAVRVTFGHAGVFQTFVKNRLKDFDERRRQQTGATRRPTDVRPRTPNPAGNSDGLPTAPVPQFTMNPQPQPPTSCPPSPVGTQSTTGGLLSQSRAQVAVDQAFQHIRGILGGLPCTAYAVVQGVVETPDGASADLRFVNMSYRACYQILTWHAGTAEFRRYNDGRVLLTRINTDEPLCHPSFTFTDLTVR